ncbi:MAG TPA: FxLYD domain-containing protein [Bryobacteraceae bacterium]|jgi:hypothetical protein|nr:FxLYD domain-containing protein [Bryobacteraceae bacterium]
MATPAPVQRKLPITPLIVAAIIVAVIVIGFVYLDEPSPSRHTETAPSPEVKAYVKNLALSDVHMTAAENFMKQQVVEVRGNITNNGSQALYDVEVYCLFYGVDGREIYREKVPIYRSTTTPLNPHETHAFRLPFDSLPDGWNQAIPKLVIAQIKFSK